MQILGKLVTINSVMLFAFSVVFFVFGLNALEMDARSFMLFVFPAFIAFHAGSVGICMRWILQVQDARLCRLENAVDGLGRHSKQA